MDQVPYPGPPLAFHIRTNSLFLLLWFFDLLMFAFAVESMMSHGVGGIILFGSEVSIGVGIASALTHHTLSVCHFASNSV